MTTLYSLRTLALDHHTIAKFDDSFNVAAVYNLHPKGHDYTCDCPANSRAVILRPCKHRRMLPLLLAKADPNAFLDFETVTWHQPLGDLLRPEAGDLAGREALPDEPYGVSPMMEAVADLKAFNALPPEERAAATRAFVGAQLMGEALGSPIPAQPAQAPTIRRR